MAAEQIVSDWAKTLPPEPAAQPTSVSAASSEESQAPALEPTTGASSDGQADHQGNDAVPHASARQRESHRGRGRRGSQTPRHRQGSVNSSSEQPQQVGSSLLLPSLISSPDACHLCTALSSAAGMLDQSWGTNRPPQRRPTAAIRSTEYLSAVWLSVKDIHSHPLVLASERQLSC